MKTAVKTLLSKSQYGIYIDSLSDPDSTLYNIPLLGTIPSSIDTEKLKAALEKTVEAHPGLNSRLFADDNGDVYQTPCEKPFEVKVIRQSDEEFQKTRENLVRKFDLLGGELCRIEIYITPSANYLFEDFHHIVYDGTSANIFSKDVGTAYSGEDLAVEKFTPFDISPEENALSGGEEYNKAKSFFDSLLDGADSDCLPVPDMFEDVPKQERLTRVLSVNDKQLAVLRHSLKISTTAFFTAVMGFVTAKYNYRDDSVISTVYNGRKSEKTARTVSMLVKTLPFVTNLTGNPRISEFLKKAAPI